jgi:hypothetical protein
MSDTEEKEFLWDAKREQWCHKSVLKRRQKERAKKKPAKKKPAKENNE